MPTVPRKEHGNLYAIQSTEYQSHTRSKCCEIWVLLCPNEYIIALSLLSLRWGFPNFMHITINWDKVQFFSCWSFQIQDP